MTTPAAQNAARLALAARFADRAATLLQALEGSADKPMADQAAWVQAYAATATALCQVASSPPAVRV